ncbi:MAG: hypothetical protein WC636_00835 [Candidatus Margulisiibacteriota bacterium]
MAGFFEDALETARNIRSFPDRAEALVAVAVEMSKAEVGAMIVVKIFTEALSLCEKYDFKKRVAVEMSKAGIDKTVFGSVFIDAVEAKEYLGFSSWYVDDIVDIVKEAVRAGIGKEQGMAMFYKVLGVAQDIKLEPFEQARLLSATLEALAKTGLTPDQLAEGFAEALQAARATKDTFGIGLKALSLRWLASAMARAGLQDEAKKVFMEILEDETHPSIIEEIIIEMVRAGLFSEALEIVNRAKCSDITLKTLADELTKAGQFSAALQVAAKMDYIYLYKADVIEGIAIGVAQATNSEEEKVNVFTEAAHMVNTLQDEKLLTSNYREFCFCNIISEVVKIGLFDEALVLVNAEDSFAAANLELKNSAITIVAVGMAKAGLFAQALSLARTIYPLSTRAYKAEALMAIAAEMTAAGLGAVDVVPVYLEASEAAQCVERSDRKAKVLMEIAFKIAELKPDKKIIVKAFSNAFRSMTYRPDIQGAAVRMVRAGLAFEALQVAKDCFKEKESRWFVDQLIKGITSEIARTGPGKEKLHEICTELLDAVRTMILFDSERDPVLRDAAIGMAKAGLFAEALQIARKAPDSPEKVEALNCIGAEMASTGLPEDDIVPVFAEALAMMQMLGLDRGEMAEKITIEMARAGLFEKALEVARKIAAQGERPKALRRIAIEMARAGEGRDAVAKIFIEALLDWRMTDNHSDIKMTLYEMEKLGFDKTEMKRMLIRAGFNKKDAKQIVSDLL